MRCKICGDTADREVRGQPVCEACWEVYTMNGENPEVLADFLGLLCAAVALMGLWKLERETRK
jgi:hypothetical protein